jgi:hypothetical protein
MGLFYRENGRVCGDWGEQATAKAKTKYRDPSLRSG